MISRRALLAAATASASRLIADSVPAGPPEYWTLTQAASALRRRAISSEELTRHCLERIARLDPALNSFITVTADLALSQARAADRQFAKSRNHHPLFGIPIALKDNIDTTGIKTT